MNSPSPTDLEAAAKRAGLNYCFDDVPGIRRRRCGRGFTYVDHLNRRIDETVRSRIERLAIPPAWTSVWISADIDNHLQATGIDDRGRKQYRYHERWSTARNEAKFSGLPAFGAGLSTVRRTVDRHLDGEGLHRERVSAAVVRLLDTTLIRIGTERYAAENDTYGATTLAPGHVTRVDAGYRLDFVAKSGLPRSVDVNDPAVGRVIAESLSLDQPQLFCFVDTDGVVRDLTAAHVNQYLLDASGRTATAKTFRTWGATVRAVEHLVHSDDDVAPARRLLAAIDAAADALGNTRAVCRRSYVAPSIGDAFESGRLLETWRTSRATRWRSRVEEATLASLT